MENNEAYEEAINYLKTSPMFNISLSSNELFHSNFLYWIWQVNKECFKTIINSLIGEKNYWEDNWKGKKLEVRREYKNFDLSIVEVLNTATTEGEIDNTVNSVDNTTSESDNGDYTTDGLILFVLENKVKSIPYAQQLLKYNEKIEKHNVEILKKEILTNSTYKRWTNNTDLSTKLENRKEKSTCKKVLLSLTDAYPDLYKTDAHPYLYETGEFEGWIKRSYDDYLSFLKAVADSKTIKCEEWDKYSNIFTDYREYVKNLITCIKKWDKFPDFNVGKTEFLDYPFLPTAEELRLHALYSKYNYAKLCCILMQNNEIKCRKVQYIRKQDDIILLTGQDPKKKSQFKCYNACFDKEDVLIGVGYGYTNMKPLLEVKVVKKTDDDNKLIYIIQVQGDKYEHGIIRKGTRREVKNFIESNDGPKNWVNSIDENDIFGKPINDRYNGYDDTYSMVYKYRQITDKAKTEDVINYMVKDVKKLLEGLGNK